MLDIIGFDWREGDKRGNETSLELRTEELEEYRPTTNNTNIEALDTLGTLNEQQVKSKEADGNAARQSNDSVPGDSTARISPKGPTPVLVSFTERIAQLEVHKKKHGHFHVRRDEDKSLADFCINIRHVRRNPSSISYNLTDQRVNALDAIGFDWGNSTRKRQERKNNQRREESAVHSMRGWTSSDRIKQSMVISLSAKRKRKACTFFVLMRGWPTENTPKERHAKEAPNALNN